MCSVADEVYLAQPKVWLCWLKLLLLSLAEVVVVVLVGGGGDDVFVT